MRGLIIGTVVALSLSLAACGGDDDESSDAASAAATTEAPGDATVVPTTQGITLADVPDVVGQTFDEATATLGAAGLTMRIIRIDGADQAATADFIDNRVNVAIETQADGSQLISEVISLG